MAIEINARKREAQGTGASRRLRHQGMVPGILYGGDKDPVKLEFDHQAPVGLRKPGGSTLPNREHIHVVVRTPNANDYGTDLLRQHYAQHPH